MDEGVAAIGVVAAPRPRPPRRVREDEGGVRVGAASEVAKRDWCGGGGVANAEGVVDLRRLLRRAASPGDE